MKKISWIFKRESASCAVLGFFVHASSSNHLLVGFLAPSAAAASASAWSTIVSASRNSSFSSEKAKTSLSGSLPPSFLAFLAFGFWLLYEKTNTTQHEESVQNRNAQFRVGNRNFPGNCYIFPSCSCNFSQISRYFPVYFYCIFCCYFAKFSQMFHVFFIQSVKNEQFTKNRKNGNFPGKIILSWKSKWPTLAQMYLL